MVFLVVAEELIIPYLTTCTIVEGLPTCDGLNLLLSGIGVAGFFSTCYDCGFTANIIQFGMDQLHDSPGEDQSLFIHWFMWLYYISVFLSQLAWNLTFTRAYLPYGTSLLLLIELLVTVLLIMTLCVARCRRRWFLIEPGRINLYKLVSRVTKFASQHKIPVRRSAFTYCEDD